MLQFDKMTDEALRRAYARQLADNGTSTMEQECRRQYILQEAGDELQRRGIALPQPDHAFWHAA